MSKPEDIPQDVWDKAFHEMDCHCPAVMFGDDTLQQSVNTAIARAIMASKAEEREACAKVADESGINPFNGPAHDVVSKEIAVAIRKRGDG